MSPSWCLLCFVALAMTCGWTLTLGEDVFASSAHLRMLAEGESRIKTELGRYISEEETRMRNLQRLLEAVAESDPGLSVEPDKESISANPLGAFHLIKRFATTWKRIWDNVSNFTAYEVLRAKMAELHDFVPTEEDVRGAQFALMRLQATYDLPVADLLSGVIAGQQTKSLSQSSAVETGMLGLEMGRPDRTLEWLEAALNHSVEPLVHPSVIFHGLGKAHALKGDYLKALDCIKEAVRQDPTNPSYLRDLLPPVDSHQGVTIDHNIILEYRRLCREGAFADATSFHRQPNQLSCSLKRSRAVPLLSFKMEPLSEEAPGVTLFHDFVSDRESHTLRDSALHVMQRAKVGNSVNSFISHGRLGKIAWLNDETSDPLVGRLSRRISDVTNLNITFPTAETLQVSNYGIGGHYKPHYDYDSNRHRPGNKASPELRAFGDRMATFMIYLNEVEVGGATVFPLINLWTKPIKNAAVFWYNYKSDGQMDANSLHAACPVLIGDKWVANKWIREHGQEFHRRCSDRIKDI